MPQQQCALIGFPDDKGVYNNGGRPGAAEGPSTFRAWWQKPKGVHQVQSAVKDLGDNQVFGEDIPQSHANAVEMVRQSQEEFGKTLIVGGGHDYAFPHLKGVSETLGKDKKMGCINLDPHFDLRPNENKILSGSPFYMALEDGVMEGQNLVEFGIQRHCNGIDLWRYAESKKVKIFPYEDMRFGRTIEAFKKALYELSHHCDTIVISLDLDAVNMAYAPGVSAPAVEGFTPSEMLEVMKLAANTEQVKSIGIYELNPTYDIDNHTARFAVTTAYHFLDEKLEW